MNNVGVGRLWSTHCTSKLEDNERDLVFIMCGVKTSPVKGAHHKTKKE